MEEKRSAKQVSMKPVDKEKQQKLSYEELNNTCAQLYQQNQQLLRQLSQMNMTNMFKRLDYLFLVLKYESVIKNPEFIASCVDEIKTAITVADDEEDKQS